MILRSLLALMAFMIFAGDTRAGQSRNQNTEALQIAEATGRVTGDARYCEIDPEFIDNYEGRANAKIAGAAFDDLDAVLARVTFKNTADISAALAPEQGCEKLARDFPVLIRELE